MPASILFVDHALALGGAEYSLLNLMQHLDAARWRPILACAGGPVAKSARAADIVVAEIAFPRLRSNPQSLLDLWSGAKRLLALARRYQVELVHSNTVRTALYGALAAKMAGLPFVWHMRDFWLSETRPRRLAADRLGKRLLVGLAKVVITNSEAVARHLPRSPKVQIVYNGVNLSAFRNFSHPRSTFRVQYDIPSDAPLVGIVGRLRPWKGQVEFLQAMALLKDACPKAWFVVAGGAIFGEEDDYPVQLQKMAQGLGIAQRTRFTGHLADPRFVFAALDVLVHCGQPEPFGLVNIEAMALATPVVAYAHGALPEIVVDGETGLLVQPHDQVALASAVAGLLSDEANRRKMGEAARARVVEKFTVQHTAARVMALYDRVLKRAGSELAGDRAARQRVAQK